MSSAFVVVFVPTSRNVDIQNSAEGEIQFEVIKCIAKVFFLLFKVNLKSNRFIICENILINIIFAICSLLLETKV